MRVIPNTFGMACYEDSSIRMMVACLLERRAYPADLKKWGILPTQWRREIAYALLDSVDDLRDKFDTRLQNAARILGINAYRDHKVQDPLLDTAFCALVEVVSDTVDAAFLATKWRAGWMHAKCIEE